MNKYLIIILMATTLWGAAYRGLEAAEAESRHALIIGNNAYQHARPLVNPSNDAAVMAASLEQVGFQVTLKVDTDLKGFRGAVREFIQGLPKGSVALVFFAGHGVQIKGQNYLIPVDAQMAEEFEVPDETVAMDTLMRGLEQAETSLNIVILDCCRNDPYSRSWRGSRSAPGAGGLSMPTDMPQGMFIAFSTSPGKTAEDGEGANSTYTKALATELLTPGVDFERVFKTVGAQVSRATNGQQEPWVNTKFYGQFVFKQAVGNGEAGSAGTMNQAPQSNPSEAAAASASMTSASANGARTNGGHAEASNLQRSNERILLEAPPFEEMLAPHPAAASSSIPSLKQLSAKSVSVTGTSSDDFSVEWLEVPNPFMQTLGTLPSTVPARAGDFIAVRAFRDAVAGYVVYGENFSAGSYLTIWTPDFQQLVAQLDFSHYRTAPKTQSGEEAYTDQPVRYARIVGDVLYVGHHHMTYAKSSGGQNGYLTAIDLNTNQLIWRSKPLVSNAGNFEISGDAILSGYGFTAEDDYMYVIHRLTGEVISKVKVKNGPESMKLHGDILSVRTYDMEYRFQVK